MAAKPLEQHIAVFGESGSGKTVLLSSFYGLMREKPTMERTHLDVIATDPGQSDRLMGNFLGMRDKARLPAPNRFSAEPYVFTANLPKKPGAPKLAHDAFRLVWHDYPGEWFHETPSGPEEARRRADTFRALVASDVALVLIDGAEILENRGDEGPYLIRLLTNIRNGLVPALADLGAPGAAVPRFPRIWILALTKADLLPDLDVEGLRDLVLLHAQHELDQLRTTIAGAVAYDPALAVGEDFVRLSSAVFARDAIDTSRRVGIDLILPLASVLPLERFARWVARGIFGHRVAREILRRGGQIAQRLAVFVGFVAPKLPGPLGLIAVAASAALQSDIVTQVLNYFEGKLADNYRQAVARGEMMRATLTLFAMDLNTAEDRGILLRSRR